ncbi:MAG: hypothetical protein M3120_06940 [Pseudomonadota bacterium]|nr:hypothetical protein [Pseudomonadota bacterium]
MAVLIGHSESGLYPFHAALINPRAVKGLINIEAGGTCHENFGQTEEAIRVSKIRVSKILKPWYKFLS